MSQSIQQVYADGFRAVPAYGLVYDPIVKGYDTNFWATIAGTPAVASNKLRLNADTIASLAQFRYGRLKMAINVPVAPTSSQDKRFGFYNPGTDSGIFFDITDAVFTVQVVLKGSSLYLETGTWAGHTTEQVFEIEWHKEGVVFLRAGNVVGSFAFDDGVDEALGIYSSNANADNMDVGYYHVSRVGNIG